MSGAVLGVCIYVTYACMHVLFGTKLYICVCVCVCTLICAGGGTQGLNYVGQTYYH